MDLAAKKEAREARMKAKREMIRSEAESVAATETEAVAENTPAENHDNKDSDAK